MESADIIKLIIGGVIAVVIIVYLAVNEKHTIIEWLKNISERRPDS